MFKGSHNIKKISVPGWVHFTLIKDYSVLLVKELNTLTISSELIFVSRLMGHKSICDSGNELKVDRWSAELSWECTDAKEAFLLPPYANGNFLNFN